MKVIEKLSRVYHNIFPDAILNIDIPEERLTTCSNCHYCVNPNNPKYHVKCCNYHPIQPNFIIGGLLVSDDSGYSQAQHIIRSKIKKMEGVSPLGIIPPSDFYINKKKAKCPYLKDQACSIWQFRTELCSTFFCSSVAGRSGQSFWKVLFEYLKLIDRNMSLYSLSKIGFDADMIHYNYFNDSFNSSKTESSKEVGKDYDHHWADWKGREEELYKLCYQEILKIDSEIFEHMIGWEGQWFINKLSKMSIQFKENVIPDRLKILPIRYTKDPINSNVFNIMESTQELQCSKIQSMLLRMFDGHNDSFDVIRKSKELQQDITTLVYDLIQEKLLQPI